MSIPINVLPDKSSMKELTDNWKELLRQAKDVYKLSYNLSNTIDSATFNKDYKPKNFIEFFRGIETLQKMLVELSVLITKREKIRNRIYGKPKFDTNDAQIFKSLGKPFSHLFYDAAADFSGNSGNIPAAITMLREIITKRQDYLSPAGYGNILSKSATFEVAYKQKRRICSDFDRMNYNIRLFVAALTCRR